MHFDGEGSHKVSAAVLGPVISPVNFSVKWLLVQSRTIFCIILIPIIAIIHHVRSVGCLGVVSRRTGTAPNREARKVWLVAWVDASIILNINPNIEYNFRVSG